MKESASTTSTEQATILQTIRDQYLGGILRKYRTPQAFDPAAVESWRIGSGKRGVLLVHGFAGTPKELRDLGEFLAANGWRCYAPTLAGHATTTEEMAKTGWRDWVQTASEGVDELLKECDRVAVVGQSMGGTIALHLAATDPRVSAVTTLAAPLWLGGPWPIVLPWARFVYPWHSVVDRSSALTGDELPSYVWRSNRAVIQLFRFMRKVRHELDHIQSPVLVIHGGLDRVVSPKNGRDIMRGLRRSLAVKWIVFPNSGHALTSQIDRDSVNQRVLAWLDQYCPVDQRI